MYKKILLPIIVVFFCVGWARNPAVNTPVCTAGQEQKRPQLVPDGSGGAIVVWEDSRSGGEYDIYAQRIDASGTARWEADGVAVCTASGPQRYPRLIADGTGGCILTWYDRRNGRNNDIYAQRLDAEGKVLWAPGGIAVCTARGDQYDPRPVSDGTGGAFIVWYDRRNENDYDIYAQKVDGDGNIRGTRDGIAICTAKGDQDKPRLISDRKGGAILTWQDRRAGSHYDIYAQRLDSEGTVLWTPNGTAVCAEAYDQRNPQLVSESSGGAILAWQDKRSGSQYDIYAQRIDPEGTVLWTPNGVAVCTAANSQYDPRLISDARGGAVIAWQDYRGGSDCDYEAFEKQTDFDVKVCAEKQLHDWNIYLQAVDPSGRVKWNVNGVAVCTSQVDQYQAQLVSDGAGGAIITWRAADKENDHNIYAQRINPAGRPRWSEKGTAISTADGNQFDPFLVPDGRRGAIVAWYDERKGKNGDIYAQKIRASGRIGAAF